jgi:hypothetical protein
MLFSFSGVFLACAMIAFAVVFGGSTMRFRRFFMMLGGSVVCVFRHLISLCSLRCLLVRRLALSTGSVGRHTIGIRGTGRTTFCAIG